MTLSWPLTEAKHIHASETRDSTYGESCTWRVVTVTSNSDHGSTLGSRVTDLSTQQHRNPRAVHPLVDGARTCRQPPVLHSAQRARDSLNALAKVRRDNLTAQH